MNIYNVDNYEVHVDDGYLIFNNQKIITSTDILLELVRDEWRVDKKNQKYKYYTLPFYKKNNMGFDFLDFLTLPQSVQPEEVFDRIVMQEILADAISQLPLKYRQVGILYFFKGYTEVEIGNILDCSRDMAHYYKKRFLKSLQNNRELEELFNNYFKNK